MEIKIAPIISVIQCTPDIILPITTTSPIIEMTVSRIILNVLLLIIFPLTKKSSKYEEFIDLIIKNCNLQNLQWLSR